MKTRVWLPLAMAASLLGTAPALAQEAAKDYPSRPIRMIVPNAPGSSVDTLSRIMGTGLSQVIGQQIVIDNRAGAAGVIGMEIAKNANPDGYTMISATTAASTIARILQKNPTFDPVKDYDYVVQFAETPNLLWSTPRCRSSRSRSSSLTLRAGRRQLTWPPQAPGRKAISPARISSRQPVSYPCTCRTRAAALRSPR